MIFKFLKSFIKNTICLLLLLISVFACQYEVTNITSPNDQETIIQNSSLATLLLNTATLDGSQDNIIDNANCILVNLPVTVQVNGTEITINNIEDYEVIEAAFNAINTNNDTVDILFPITITLNDYTIVEIANDEELQAFVEVCSGENEDDDDIECIDFQYPIIFSIYDANFQVIETVTINGDEALYSFIENLEGGVLASLNFPVTMILSDGATVEVNNNQELEITISEAEDTCDEDDDNDWNDDNSCDINEVEVNLIDCIWTMSSYNNDTSFNVFNIDFMEDGIATITSSTEIYTTIWTISLDGEIYLGFSNISGGNVQVLNGNFILVECTPNQLILHDPSDNSIELVLDKNCDQNENPFECFESFDAVLEACDNNNDDLEVFNLPTVFDNCLNPDELVITYHETLVDADTATNTLPNSQAYVNISNPQTIYTRVEVISTGAFQVFEISLLVNNCNDSGCGQDQVEAYLQTCVWNITTYSGTEYVSDYDLSFNNNQELIVTDSENTYTSVWELNDDNGTPTIVLNISAPNIQVLSGTWELVECEEDRLQFSSATDTFVIEQDCN